MTTINVFQGSDVGGLTKNRWKAQTEPHLFHRADRWYWAPFGYEGDVPFSEPFRTCEGAIQDAQKASFFVDGDGYLCRYDNGDQVVKASEFDRIRSEKAAETDGGVGAISLEVNA